MTEQLEIYECEVSGHVWLKEDWVIAGYTLYRCICCFDTCWRIESGLSPELDKEDE